MILAHHLRNTSPWLNEFGRFFDAALRGAVTAPRDLRVHEDEGGWTLEADFPGVSRDELEIGLKDKTLQLRVNSDTRYRLPLGDKIEAAGVSAKLEHGVLTIRLPKTEVGNDTHRIEIH